MLPSRWIGVENKVPASLSELRGPTSGSVTLPLHICWSGLDTFDLDNPKLRLSLYRTVLMEGQRDDMNKYLNGDILQADWPILRRLIARPVRQAWEGQLNLGGVDDAFY